MYVMSYCFTVTVHVHASWKGGIRRFLDTIPSQDVTTRGVVEALGV